MRRVETTSRHRAGILFWLLLLAIGLWSITHGVRATQAPEFTHTDKESWINSPPLTLKALRGRVVLVDFWTFDCWNCQRSLPWLKSLEKRYRGRPFQVIGVHTPEFPHERIRGRLLDRIKLLNIEHPVMVDNDFSYWNAVGTRGWPSFYVIDKGGRMRVSQMGETHPGDAAATRVEKLIDRLLAETTENR
jgi:thiol-disulfide isomerase/thioredoxin